MARPLKGDVVVIPFPFSDLTQTKRRPALVLAAPDGNDVILCQITGQAIRDRYAVARAKRISRREACTNRAMSVPIAYSRPTRRSSCTGRAV